MNVSNYNFREVCGLIIGFQLYIGSISPLVPFDCYNLFINSFIKLSTYFNKLFKIQNYPKEKWKVGINHLGQNYPTKSSLLNNCEFKETIWEMYRRECLQSRDYVELREFGKM